MEKEIKIEQLYARIKFLESLLDISTKALSQSLNTNKKLIDYLTINSSR